MKLDEIQKRLCLSNLKGRTVLRLIASLINLAIKKSSRVSGRLNLTRAKWLKGINTRSVKSGLPISEDVISEPRGNKTLILTFGKFLRNRETWASNDCV